MGAYPRTRGGCVAIQVVRRRGVSGTPVARVTSSGTRCSLVASIAGRAGQSSLVVSTMAGDTGAQVIPVPLHIGPVEVRRTRLSPPRGVNHILRSRGSEDIILQLAAGDEDKPDSGRQEQFHEVFHFSVSRIAAVTITAEAHAGSSAWMGVRIGVARIAYRSRVGVP